MKIQKKYQGAIPLNRIANEHDESEINTYSTNYVNSQINELNTLIPQKIQLTFNYDYVYDSDLMYTCFQMGKMVFLNIHAMSFHTIPENGTKIISGLPGANYITCCFEGGSHSADGSEAFRGAVDQGGNMVVHWGSPSQIGDSANKQYRICLIYETIY